jgi:5-methylcytosine-specific restriction endonuclease McrA
VKVPKATREAVKARSGGRCVMCEWLFERGELDAYRPRRIVHLHHVFAEQRHPALALEAANLIGLCMQCHFDHENFAGHGAPRRIPRDALPAETLELALREGLRHELERLYIAAP